MLVVGKNDQSQTDCKGLQSFISKCHTWHGNWCVIPWPPRISMRQWVLDKGVKWMEREKERGEWERDRKTDRETEKQRDRERDREIMKGWKKGRENTSPGSSISPADMFMVLWHTHLSFVGYLFIDKFSPTWTQVSCLLFQRLWWSSSLSTLPHCVVFISRN